MLTLIYFSVVKDIEVKAGGIFQINLSLQTFLGVNLD